MEVSDKTSLTLTSHQLTWSAMLYFSDKDTVLSAQKQLEQNKHAVRNHKVQQIEKLFALKGNPTNGNPKPNEGVNSGNSNNGNAKPNEGVNGGNPNNGNEGVNNVADPQINSVKT